MLDVIFDYGVILYKLKVFKGLNFNFCCYVGLVIGCIVSVIEGVKFNRMEIKVGYI